MTFPALQQYLARLHDSPVDTTLWLDEQGKAHGRYFNSTLTSTFQPIRLLESGRITGVQAFMRSYSTSDEGLSLWKLLDTVATDDQSIELDRLCRLLHAVNFYRQPDLADHDLYLSVHARLLSAVDSNHGTSFRHVLDVLGLPHRKIVLQLPPIQPDQAWLLNYVADNYRRNGFRLAVNAANAHQGLALLDEVQPDVIKVDVREITDEAATLQLLRNAGSRNVPVIFKRVETTVVRDKLQKLGRQSGRPIVAQGYFWDRPQAVPASAANAFGDDRLGADAALHVSAAGCGAAQ
jgi:EAL domain-containing protein (putative c-di-GMP-specific phosphodiesterase class I)